MSQSQSYGQRGNYKQHQHQALGQVQTQAMRSAYDALDEHDAADSLILAEGGSPVVTDVGDDEELDADLNLDDQDDDVSEDLEMAVPEHVLEEHEQHAPPPGATEFLGSRPPTVLIRTYIDGDTVRARPVVRRASRDINDALEELVKLVETVLQKAQTTFSESDWAVLSGDRPGTLTQRMQLLCRAALQPSEAVMLSEQRGYKPKERQLARYRSKLATLPDGTPFSLRLLLSDGRGKKKNERQGSGLKNLPDAVVLLGLRRALSGERDEGDATYDHEFGWLLRESLQELLGDDLLVDTPTDRELRTLRGKLKREGLEKEFPKRSDRQTEYARIAANPQPVETVTR